MKDLWLVEIKKDKIFRVDHLKDWSFSTNRDKPLFEQFGSYRCYRIEADDIYECLKILEEKENDRLIRDIIE